MSLGAVAQRKRIEFSQAGDLERLDFFYVHSRVLVFYGSCLGLGKFIPPGRVGQDHVELMGRKLHPWE